MTGPLVEPRMFDKEAGYWDSADWAAAVGKRMRDEKSVHKVTMPDGVPVWVVTRYEDVHALLTDDSYMLSKAAAGIVEIMGQYGLDPEDLNGMFYPNLMFTDPPDHTRLRRLLAGTFTSRRIDALRPRVKTLADDLLGGFPSQGSVDLIADLAFPLPLIVICELLGVPTDPGLRDDLHRWTADLMENQRERAKAATGNLVAFFTGLIEQKMREPGDDLLSALLQADGDGLQPAVLMGNCILLLVAGHETTMNFIGNSARWLLSEPQQWQLLAERPDLLPNALQECLRFDSPILDLPHYWTRKRITIGGETIPARQIVFLNVHAANRDEARFPHADKLDLEREDAKRHLSFGGGIHYCIGAQLGLMEAEIALGKLTERYPNASLVDDGALRRRVSPIMLGYRDLWTDLGG
jgi:cytochrome P450